MNPIQKLIDLRDLHAPMSAESERIQKHIDAMIAEFEAAMAGL